MIKTEYKGFEIKYDENRDGWTCEIATKKYGYEYDKLSKMKEKIDNFIQTQKKFNRINAFVENGWDKPYFINVTVTSLIDDEYAWVVDEKKARTKRPIKSILKDTPENRQITQEIESHRKEIKNLNDLIDDLKRSLVIINGQ